MIKKISISSYIFEHPILNSSYCFSSADEIDAFFSAVPQKAIDAWPFDFSRYNFNTRYLGVKVYPETWKEEAHCIIQAEVFDQKRSAVIEQDFHFGFDNNLIIDICSVRSSFSEAYPQKMKIARRLSENNFQFLLAYDKKKSPQKPSIMRVYASSGITKQNIQTCGGYVWANNGFDFADQDELKATRLSFKRFLFRRGIDISDKKLKLFTKPCHFSAYGCGILFSFNKHLYRAGKAFMLQHSWRGIQKTSSKNSRERRFANAYYKESIPALRRLKALRQLEKKYLSLLRSDQQKSRLLRIRNRYRLLRRFISIKAQKYFNH